MKIIYPIYFTLSGRGVNWRDPSNRILVTIEYSDDRKLRVGKLERHHMSLPFKFMNGLVSGYFIQNSQYVRVTNLVASWIAAKIIQEYPDLWPETVRALIIHSATWPDAMLRKVFNGKKKLNRGDFRRLIRTVGYGVPDVERAIYSMKNSVDSILFC